MSLGTLRDELTQLKDPVKAKVLTRFFKTGKGEYGEGDVFLGLTVPQSRKLTQKHKDLTFTEIAELLKSKVHEERLIALLILVHNFQAGDAETKDKIYNFYITHTKYVNNWDLVDLSADKIAGAYLLDKPRDLLYKLAKSKNVWERRIAMITTYQFIKERKEYQDTFKIADILLGDTHDLIHKAVGWMLREVGKRISEEALVGFLHRHYRQMPRTCLRYAIERLPEKMRRAFIDGLV